MKKRVLLYFIFQICVSILFGNDIATKKKLIQADSWLYDAINILCADNEETALIDVAPMSYEEYNFYFSKIDYDSLSDNSKKLYTKIKEYLSYNSFEIDFSPVKIGINFSVSPQFNYKTNSNVNWSYLNPYSSHKYYDYNEKNYKESTFIDASFSKINLFYKPIALAPLYINFSDFGYIQTEPFIGKSIVAMNNEKNFINIPFASNEVDFLLPRVAYFSTGHIWNEKIGFGLQIAKDGFQFGRSLLGSVIYNNTFETDGYIKANLYSKNFRFEINTVQMGKERYLYLHDLEINLFKRFRFSLIEGTLINDDFELRFLNPLMIMHSYGAWRQYSNDLEHKYYSESHVCQYIGFTVDIIPFKNCRIYALYSQNEIQANNELSTTYGKTLPNGIGAQIGIEYNLPCKNNNWFIFNLEGLYTSPYLYVKQGKDWSLISYRYNMLSNKSIPIYSWIGSPFGPDTLAFEAKITYKKFDKFTISLSYLLAAHGENNFSIFDSTYTNEEGTFYSYYPSVLRLLGLLSDKEAEDIARDMSLTGIIQYTNQIKINYSYSVNKNLKLNSELLFLSIINNKNTKSMNTNNFQISIGCEYNLF